MTYAAQADLLARVTAKELQQLTDDSRTGEINATVVSEALAEASAQVDSYCRTRYATPLQPCVDATRITRDITVYLLYSRRPTKIPDDVRQRYTDAIGLLKDISTGKASLDQQTGSPAQVSSGGAVLPSRNDERFTEHNLQGFC